MRTGADLESGRATAVAPATGTRDLWVRRVLLLAWGTIVYNAVEGVAAVGFGLSEESVALLGFGLDSWIEVASAGLVLWRFSRERGAASGTAVARERRAATGIGALFLVLAAVTIAGAALKLRAGSPPDTALPGIVVSSLSLSFMFFLWIAKSRAARALDSATVASDAACSLACIKLSSVLLVGSLLFAVAPSLWWADSAAAIVLAVLIGREGFDTVRAARREDFTGGCGCS